MVCSAIVVPGADRASDPTVDARSDGGVSRFVAIALLSPRAHAARNASDSRRAADVPPLDVTFTTITALTATRAPHDHDTISVCFGIDVFFTLLGPATRLSLSFRKVVSLVGNLFGATIFVWVCLATSVKRLHDRDRSGWWIVPFFVLPSFSSNIQDWLGETTFTFPIGLALIILSIWGFIELGFLRGTRSTNRFRPNPLGEQRARPRSTEARLRATSPWDQQSEIELAPHFGSPPPGMRVKPGA